MRGKLSGADKASIDPSSSIHPDAVIGPYAVIGPDCHIGAGVVVGPHAILSVMCIWRELQNSSTLLSGHTVMDHL